MLNAAASGEDGVGPWWARPDLRFNADGELTLAGHRLGVMAAAHGGSPIFFYNAERVRSKLEMVHGALRRTGLAHRVFYAMKANRFTPLLTYIRLTGLCGIDVCSPQELGFALACGFEESDLSYTATSVSNEDIEVLARHPGVLVNCDSLSTIRRLGARCPGRDIGLRVNPGKGVAYGDNRLLQYSGRKTTKFGIYREHFDEALALAMEYGLRVSRIHFHVGIGYLPPQLPMWEEMVGDCAWFVDHAGGIESVNLGGGLGLPHVAADRPLDLAAWAGVIERHFGPRGVEVCVEPGDFIVKDSGVLVLQVNTVERKRQTDFIGVNGGFNLAVEPFFYGLPCEPVPCRAEPKGAPRPVTIAGNINEALDVWADGVLLPPLEEGDYLAFINAGGYASAMSSNHCMRGQFSERLLFPRHGAQA
ncbi:MAG: diaminopimelate decarboxylase [Candidatus Sedimenticola endophacoides]